MPKKHYIIYADESDKKGDYYSNFFGGVLLKASEREKISHALNAKKAELGLKHEVKWQYVDQSNFDRYAEFARFFFSFVANSQLKIRIMFTQNMRVPKNLEQRHRDDQYFLLYYQFIKHAFGLKYSDFGPNDPVSVAILPDKIPDSKERVERFKDYLCRIPNSAAFSRANVVIPRSDIADVDSQEHVILQGLDLVLGAMCSRLNEKLRAIPEGKRRRGKRTRAKEQLYRSINAEVRNIYPNFNIGVGTACHGGPSDRWDHPYRHWLFMPANFEMDKSKGKKAAPGGPT